ncbi:MAG: hypothetical protein HYV35_03820 [Lentisphaerae bacterium]|nr:hypothetical protein [Lentisphaerota bacterium]
MTPANFRLIAGKKFMWDGVVYDSPAAAAAREQDYAAQGFETARVEEDGKVLLYTRRVVKEIVLQGTPPPARL